MQFTWKELLEHKFDRREGLLHVVQRKERKNSLHFFFQFVERRHFSDRPDHLKKLRSGHATQFLFSYDSLNVNR